MSSKARLAVDYREGSVIAELQRLQCEFSTENLPVADFELEGAGERVLVERKTGADLLASLTDHRYKQQKERLKVLSQEGAKVIILLEGADVHSGANARLRAAYLAITLSKWCCVVTTQDTVQTATYIHDLQQTLTRWEERPRPSGPVLQSCSKVSKKDCRTPLDSAMAALTCVRGVSSEKASAVMKAVGSLADVGAAEPSVVADVQCGVKRRRLGKEVASRIHEMLHATHPT